MPLFTPDPVPSVQLPTVTVPCPHCDQSITVSMKAVFDHVDYATTPPTSDGYVRAETQHACSAGTGQHSQTRP